MKRQRGFTLIEILVVIFIIAVLTGIGLVSFSGAQKQARDTQRRSDLGQYRNILENYSAANAGVYPIHYTAVNIDSNTCGSLTELTAFVGNNCPVDPFNEDAEQPLYRYKYLSDSSGLSFAVYAKLETGGYWYTCSAGKTSKSAIDVPVLATCTTVVAPTATPTPRP